MDLLLKRIAAGGKIVLSVLLLVCLVPGYCSADKIYFKKNNEILEGMIIQENDEKVLLEMKGGAVVFLKSEIEHIERSLLVEYVIEPREVALPEMVDLSKHLSPEHFRRMKELTKNFDDLYLQWREKRGKMRRAKREVGQAQKKFERQSKKYFFEFTKFNEAQAITKNELKISNETKRYVYWQKAFQKEKKQLQQTAGEFEKTKLLVDELDYRIAKIYNNLQEMYVLGNDLTAEMGQLIHNNFITDNEIILKDLEKKQLLITNAFSEDATKLYEDKRGVIVVGFINNKEAHLIVDENASFLTLCLEFANEHKLIKETMKDRYGIGGWKPAYGDRLQLPKELDEEVVNLQLLRDIDPYKVPIVVKSVKIGSTVVKNVPALISRDIVEKGVDGVLGRSFLRNFVYAIDQDKRELTLKEFKPDDSYSNAEWLPSPAS
ncbi:MAG: retroviral-like aspartic protease family protein [Candidatus Omnitrophica bacterium]|nr:retroviral-like aspartic protease family protein [Candidatus Omnitrophota bacterium]